MANEGMIVLSEGEGPVVADVIVVHGLCGDAIATWTAKDEATEADVCWPKESLPKDIPNARIMTWGYDSKITEVKNYSSQNSLFGHAGNLNMDLAGQRRNEEEVL